MPIAVLGTGFIGGTLGRALAGSGHRVTFGSSHPDDDDVAVDSAASVASIRESLESAEVVIVAVPAAAVAELGAEHSNALDGKLVIDATNRMDAPVANRLPLSMVDHFGYQRRARAAPRLPLPREVIGARRPMSPTRDELLQQRSSEPMTRPDN